MNLQEWEACLVSLLRAPDPAAALESLRASPHDPMIDAIDTDGLIVASRLVVRLRFERLIDGNVAAARWFNDDPTTFAAAFRRYHVEVPAAAWMPAEEGALWDAWRKA